MVFSFRQTVATWVEPDPCRRSFHRPASNEIVGPTSFIPPEAIRFFRQRPRWKQVDTFREVDLPLTRANDRGRGVISGEQPAAIAFSAWRDDEIMERFHREPCVLVSESFARRHRVRDGEILPLATPDGMRRFPIAGTFLRLHARPGDRLHERENFRRDLEGRSREQRSRFICKKGASRRSAGRQNFARSSVGQVSYRFSRTARCAPAFSRFSIRLSRSLMCCARSR